MVLMTAITSSYGEEAYHRCALKTTWRRSSADERALDDETAGVAVRAFLEAEALDQRLDIPEHRHRAADHDAVGFGVQRLDAEIGEEAAVFDQPRDAAHARRDLAGGRAVVGEAAGRQLADQRVARGLREQRFAVS